VLEPRADNLSELKEFVADIFNEERYVVELALAAAATEAAKVEIRNGTWINGLGVETGELLKQQGFIVTKITNADRRDYQKTVIYNLNDQSKPNSLKYLKAKFGANVAVSPPAWLATQALAASPDPAQAGVSPDFIIILGNNLAI